MYLINSSRSFADRITARKHVISAGDMKYKVWWILNRYAIIEMLQSIGNAKTSSDICPFQMDYKTSQDSFQYLPRIRHTPKAINLIFSRLRNNLSKSEFAYIRPAWPSSHSKLRNPLEFQLATVLSGLIRSCGSAQNSYAAPTGLRPSSLKDCVILTRNSRHNNRSVPFGSRPSSLTPVCIAETVVRNTFEASMYRSEDCLHCSDLQAELEEVRA